MSTAEECADRALYWARCADIGFRERPTPAVFEAAPEVTAQVACGLADMWAKVGMLYVHLPDAPVPVPGRDEDGNCTACGHPLYHAATGGLIHIGGTVECAELPGVWSG